MGGMGEFWYIKKIDKSGKWHVVESCETPFKTRCGLVLKDAHIYDMQKDGDFDEDKEACKTCMKSCMSMFA